MFCKTYKDEEVDYEQGPFDAFSEALHVRAETASETHLDRRFFGEREM